MKKSLTLFILIVLSFSSLASADQPSLIELLEESKKAIVTIKAQVKYKGADAKNQQKGLFKKKELVEERVGAGVIIDPSGYIVTNTHTIVHAKKVKVILQDGTETYAGLAAIGQGFDFCILKIWPKSNLPTVEWGDSDQVNLGDDVINIGESYLLKGTISGGKIVAIGVDKNTQNSMSDLFQININLYKGDSGGPLLDQKGHLIGLMVAKQTRADKSSFAVPSNKIRKQLMEYLAKIPNP